MLETIVSLFGPVKQAIDTYKAVTGLIKGDPQTRLLEELVNHNRAMRDGIERLSDNILYAPNLSAVEDVTRPGAQRRLDGREVREYLEPVQRALKEPILSSAVILTPDKMQRAMAKNPWEVLMDVRPLDFFNVRLPPEGVPVQFEHNGVRYMGWQARGALPMLFDCELRDLLDQGAPRPPATQGKTGGGLFGGWFGGQRGQSAPEPKIITPPPPRILTPTPAPLAGEAQIFQNRLGSGGEGPQMVVLAPGEFPNGQPGKQRRAAGPQGAHRLSVGDGPLPHHLRGLRPLLRGRGLYQARRPGLGP